MLGLKMRGLPFSIKIQDIKAFFKDYNVLNGSIKIGETVDKVKTGEAALLFADEKECTRAFLNRQGQHILHRWVELYQISVGEYLNFDIK